jgi:hypothetical protein
MKTYVTRHASSSIGLLGVALATLLMSSATALAQLDAEETEVPEVPAVAASADDADALAQKLANPIASLISVPLQSNFDFDAGSDDDGFRYTLNAQPVIPVSLTEDWNLITRVIVPFIGQNNEFSALTSDNEFGIGDIVASGFFSPKEPIALSETANLTWGVGPVLYLPTATEDVFGADQFGLGPTGVALVIDGPWTYGALVNHIWSVGETDDFDSFLVERPQINATFLQPFVTYAPGGGWSFTANLEATYDWEGEEWFVPASVSAAKIINVGGQTLSISAGPRVFAIAPDAAPEWGFRTSVTFIFPQ